MAGRKLRAGLLLFSVLAAIGLALPSRVIASIPGVNGLASVDSSGTQANADSNSSNHTVSGDGRYVVFMSSATNLVSGDTNGRNDIFIRDRTDGITTRVSISSSGTESDGSSINPAISYDGRYVVFESAADNLVSGVSSGFLHIYLHDMQTGTTSIEDTSSGGVVGNGQSEYPDVDAGGRFVVFSSTATNLVSGVSGITGSVKEIYVKDTSTSAIKVLSVGSGSAAGNNDSLQPKISCDGGIVAFKSSASNIAASPSGYTDIFVDVLGWSGDRLTDITSGSNSNSSDPSISCNGNEIVYDTWANNLAPSLPSSSESVLEYDRLSAGASVVSADSGGTPASGTSQMPAVSDDGRYVVFLSNARSNLDSSRSYDVFGNQQQTYIRDMKQGVTEVLSLDAYSGNGTSGSTDWPAISADGSIAAYDSTAEGYGKGLLVSDANGKMDVFTSETGF